MSLEGRLRRREERARSTDEPLPGRPPPAPDVSAILALQRGAGNRALVQRMMHNPTSNVVKVPLDYDDASCQRRVMTDWGYSLAFTGRAQWADLARVPLAKGRYIFGITGHTVQVDVKRKIEPGKTQIANVDDFFECHSDEENFNQDHFAAHIRVHTIWQKA